MLGLDFRRPFRLSPRLCVHLTDRLQVGAVEWKMEWGLCEDFFNAAERGDTEKVKILLAQAGTPQSLQRVGQPMSALRVACARGHVETARVLLEHGSESKE